MSDAQSTFYRLYLQPLGLPFVNADQLAEEQRQRLLQLGVSFCFETVYSLPLECAALNQARISQRVEEGGHAVPADKVISRIPRLLRHVRASLPLCDQFRAYDNSSAEQPFMPVFSLVNARIEVQCNPLPSWAADLLSGQN